MRIITITSVIRSCQKRTALTFADQQLLSTKLQLLANMAWGIFCVWPCKHYLKQGHFILLVAIQMQNQHHILLR